MLALLLALAREPPDVSALTSRPGFGDAALAVPAGAVLVNPGLTVAGPPGSTAPDVLIRIGLVEGLEARGAVVFDASGPAVTLAPSFAVAAQLASEGDLAPAVLGVLTLALPTGADPAGLALEARISGAKAFGDLGVAVNLALTQSATGTGALGTLGASYALGPLTPFVEAFVDDTVARGAPPDVWIDAGTAVGITRTVAVDVSAGATVVGDRALFVSVGASVLWP